METTKNNESHTKKNNNNNYRIFIYKYNNYKIITTVEKINALKHSGLIFFSLTKEL